MRFFSWLLGSASVACLAAGILLLLQPSTAYAGIGSNCSDCNPTCWALSIQQSDCIVNKYICVTCANPPCLVYKTCSGTFGGNCWCDNWVDPNPPNQPGGCMCN